jgi:O-antigen/teichoic acid export membrane protein
VSLRARTARALRWSAGARLVSQLASWAATLIVIRLLTPEDYGLMAMTMAVVALAQQFSDFGFEAAIVRSRTVDVATIRANFGLAVALNAGLFVLVFATAPLLSWYFDEALTWYIRAVAVTFLLAPFGMVYEALLIRALDLRRQALINESCRQVASLTSLALALAGAGVWALVAGPVAGAASRAVAFSALSPERHPPSWAPATMRAHLRFGGFVALQNVLRWASRQIDVLVLGRALATPELGGYRVAKELTALPANKLGQVLGQLPLAAFARLQRRPRHLARVLTTTLAMTLRLTVPAFAAMSALAPELVPVLLGPNWQPVVPVMTFLALAMPLQLVLTLSNQALNAIDRPAVATVAYAVLAVAIGLAAYVAAPFGLGAIAAGVAASYGVATLIVMIPIGRDTGFGPVRLAAVLWRPAAAAAALYGVVAALRPVVDPVLPAWQTLAVLALAAGAAHAAVVGVTDRRGVRATWRYLTS